MCKGTTCASFNLPGKTEDSIDLFTKFDMGFETAGFDNLKILDDIPSFPVAFLMPILFICFSTNSPSMGLKISSLFSVLLLMIVFILGWLLSIFTSLDLYISYQLRVNILILSLISNFRCLER